MAVAVPWPVSLKVIVEERHPKCPDWFANHLPTGIMVEKLHTPLPLGASAVEKAQHYSTVVQDIKAVLQGKSITNFTHTLAAALQAWPRAVS